MWHWLLKLKEKHICYKYGHKVHRVTTTEIRRVGLLHPKIQAGYKYCDRCFITIDK